MADSGVKGPLLIIDASSRRVWAGLDNGGTLTWRSDEREATLSVFELCAEVFDASQLRVEKLEGIAFCRGPGSMLGNRVAAMCIKSWRGAGLIKDIPIYGFSSLDIGIRLAALKTPDSSFSALIDARRDSWFRLTNRRNAEIEIISNDDLGTEKTEVFSFNQFPTWTQTSRSIRLIDYQPELVFENPEKADFLSLTDSIEPLALRSAEYKKWTPRLDINSVQIRK